MRKKRGTAIVIVWEAVGVGLPIAIDQIPNWVGYLIVISGLLVAGFIFWPELSRFAKSRVYISKNSSVQTYKQNKGAASTGDAGYQIRRSNRTNLSGSQAKNFQTGYDIEECDDTDLSGALAEKGSTIEQK